MKKYFLPFLLGALFSLECFAQTPQTISYQAVMRDASGQLLKETNVGVRFSILRGSENGPAVYVEEVSAVTNVNGLLSLAVGNGASVGDAAIADIDWSDGSYFLRCEVDPDGGQTYTLSLTTALTSVPYALYAEKISPSALPAWVRNGEKPVYSFSELADVPTLPTKLSDLENDMDFVSKADLASPLNGDTPSLVVTATDTASWNAKLSSYTETDPVFINSAAADIKSSDIASWNAKLSSYTESDPIFSSSVAAGIKAADTAAWNAKLSSFTETDPAFKNSAAANIKSSDISSWNAKLSSYTESDPMFSSSVAAGIKAADTAAWNAKLSSYTETDPAFKNSAAANIKSSDISSWNAKLSNYTESDPIYKNSAAAGISASDVASWNATATNVASLNEVLASFEETDPRFAASAAANIKSSDIASWNAKLSSFSENDPVYKKSVAAGISAADTAAWNAKLGSYTETDPAFKNSAAANIKASDISSWNAKLSSYTESDPAFKNSAAAGIKSSDIASWNAKLSSYTETDPAFKNSAAANIKASDISSWNAKLSSYTESDPVYKNSVAAGIKAADTAVWNAKLSAESDPMFSASAAAQISSADIARWNTNVSGSSSSLEESDPFFSASVAATIQSSDVAAWNAKADLSDVPTNVSAFTNDAQYVTMSQLSTILSSLDSLSLENRRLRSKVMSMEPKVYGTVTYQRASSNTYSFPVNTFNYAPDIYHALRDGDRIMFIVRHSERGADYSDTGTLNENGVLLAQRVGPNFKGGLAGVNDAFYGSTKVTRCKQTSYYVANTRGDTDPASLNEVHAPIDHLNSSYFGIGDDNAAVNYYKNNKTTVDTKAKSLINELCAMSAGKTFAWFTSHDYCMLPMVDWVSDHAIVFTSPANWINYMSGVAVIVHPDGSWEVYPVRNLDSGFMYRIY